MAPMAPLVYKFESAAAPVRLRKDRLDAASAHDCASRGGTGGLACGCSVEALERREDKNPGQVLANTPETLAIAGSSVAGVRWAPSATAVSNMRRP